MDPQPEASDVTSDALDQELRAALNIEPSAFFVTRVRARVASESRSRSWWPAAPRVVGLAGVALLVASAATGWLMQRPRNPRSGTESTHPPVAKAMPSLARTTTASADAAGGRVGTPVESPGAGPVTPDALARQIKRPLASGVRRPGSVNDDALSRAWLAAVDRGLVTVVIVQGEDSLRAEASPAATLDVPSITIAPVIVEAMAPFAE